jgi:hypothetical protein
MTSAAPRGHPLHHRSKWRTRSTERDPTGNLSNTFRCRPLPGRNGPSGQLGLHLARNNALPVEHQPALLYGARDDVINAGPSTHTGEHPLYLVPVDRPLVMNTAGQGDGDGLDICRWDCWAGLYAAGGGYDGDGFAVSLYGLGSRLHDIHSFGDGHSVQGLRNRCSVRDKPTATADVLLRCRSPDAAHGLGVPVKLTDIRRYHVSEFVADQKEAGRGTVTVRRLVTLLGTIFASAVKDELISTNPARDVDRPRLDRDELKAWEPEVVRVFLDRCAQRRLGGTVRAGHPHRLTSW